ncbi:MAG: asparagine synthase (glutamine-hydrolyzing) [Nitrospinae bacterium]|nr:asparagine synthase (glutamine-hydrolyzing) [Nitrospinota bacterium]
MCGITGFINPSGADNAKELARKVEGMAGAMIKRGPDAGGAWVDEPMQVALGHRRLSIIDLSPAGAQPMESASGRYVIAYNGEVYNFADVRRELETSGPVKWRGHSDTEVMLAAMERYGVKKALEKFNGMFAFALWDRQERTLTLARDRIGKKPLYYGWMNGAFLFASEMKALMAWPGFRSEIDRGALALFLRHNYVPSPYSIFKGIHKLRPGHIVTFENPFSQAAAPAPEPYWSAKTVFDSAETCLFDAPESELLDNLEKLLLDAVKIRMISDVPLGAFLSGGIDSSLVVALMQAQSAQPVKTFTIGFNEEGYNEAVHAQAVARRLRTDHTELYVTPEEAMGVIPDLPSIYDEPFADSSQIPTFLVSKLARRKVTVALSGDGGDESFGGYNRYIWAMSIWRKMRLAPRGARKVMAGIIASAPPGVLGALYGMAEFILPKTARVTNPVDKLYKLADILSLSGPMDIYRWLVSHYKNPAEIAIGATEPPTALDDSSSFVNTADFTRQMMYMDIITYLPDDILVKVDRASMGVSLEARAPLLDHRVVEFAARLSTAAKIKDGNGKWLLRKVLYRHVPQELIERPKMGFGMPIDVWLRGPLREWGEELLSEKKLREDGYFNPGPIRRQWEEHVSGRRNWHYALWNILMFQAWLNGYNHHVK